ncbi:hypothetical protein JTE90_005510 [Oedothorax gibbosus]|uniref:rRNA adenine N(6)-methyltransferase n=1 Tax=Oedothorax gibbosus TaxID=931172 RepID=A0AAV6UVI3_9ARAC|nr:hypothetical protein JTE90_005510 [Oedothorax gibbosus]
MTCATPQPDPVLLLNARRILERWRREVCLTAGRPSADLGGHLTAYSGHVIPETAFQGYNGQYKYKRVFAINIVMVRSTLLCLAETVIKQVSSSSFVQRLPPLPTPRDLLRLYKIRAHKQLSQNFLLDSRLNNKLVTKSGKVEDCYVCEVGPGPGNITRCILQNGARSVLVVEKDRRFLPSLELLADASGGRLKVILADIMDLSLENILPKELARPWTSFPPPLYIMGNLPFNISTPLIIKWLRHCSQRTGPFVHGRTQLTLTFQLEVGNRIVSMPGARDRCRLSVICQYLCHVDKLFTIPGKAFFPKPDVDVAVVKFTPRILPLIDQPFELINKVITVVFHHRQKFCRYGIENLIPKSRPDLVEEIFKKTGINPEKRSYQLEMEEWKALCDVYSQICEKNKAIRDYQYQSRKSTCPQDFEDEDIPPEDVESCLGNENQDIK